MTDAVLQRAVVLVWVTGIVVTCICARSAAGHNSARAPERVLRRRRVRSCPLQTDASGGNDPRWRPPGPRCAARLRKYLAHSLGQPAWRYARQPWTRLGRRADRGRYDCRTIHQPAVCHRVVNAADDRRDDRADHHYVPPRRVRGADTEGCGPQSSGGTRSLARAATVVLRVGHHAVHFL